MGGWFFIWFLGETTSSFDARAGIKDWFCGVFCLPAHEEFCGAKLFP
jgi:hypothetical protein